MYRTLEAEIVRQGLNKKILAKDLGMSYGTLLAKLKGEYSFTLDEAIKFKKVVSVGMPIDDLFARTEVKKNDNINN